MVAGFRSVVPGFKIQGTFDIPIAVEPTGCTPCYAKQKGLVAHLCGSSTGQVYKTMDSAAKPLQLAGLLFDHLVKYVGDSFNPKVYQVSA